MTTPMAVLACGRASEDADGLRGSADGDTVDPGGMGMTKVGVRINDRNHAVKPNDPDVPVLYSLRDDPGLHRSPPCPGALSVYLHDIIGAIAPSAPRA